MNIDWIRTKPGEKDFELFEAVPKALYPEDSPRFILGHEPAKNHLIACYVLMENDIPKGRFAFYHNPGLLYEGKTTACIGSYESVDDPAYSKAILDYAADLARSMDLEYLIGPMEGSTWNSYRFGLENDKPNFGMEPFHHAYYNDQFTSYGFEIIAEYSSQLTKDFRVNEDFVSRMEEKIKEKGFKIRGINLDDLENELYKLAELSNEGFSNNFLFTPIDEKDFVEKYMQYSALFDPEFITMIEDENGRLEAFCFAYKNPNDQLGKSLVLKSLAKRSQSSVSGIGGYLTIKAHQQAGAHNYNQVIHALMLDTNTSISISEKLNAEPHKKYRLYGLAL